MATDPAASTPILECRDLRKSFNGRVAVDGVSFVIDASETYGLLGPNGAGKTTTISLICGLLVGDGEPMATISWLTPHRWTLDGFRELIAGATLADVLPQLGVLLVVSPVLLGLGTWRQRRVLTR